MPPEAAEDGSSSDSSFWDASWSKKSLLALFLHPPFSYPSFSTRKEANGYFSKVCQTWLSFFFWESLSIFFFVYYLKYNKVEIAAIWKLLWLARIPSFHTKEKTLCCEEKCLIFTVVSLLRFTCKWLANKETSFSWNCFEVQTSKSDCRAAFQRFHLQRRPWQLCYAAALPGEYMPVQRILKQGRATLFCLQ